MSTSSLLKTGDAISGAVLSEDGRYRYRLWRRWRGPAHPACVFVMLNPSTADAEHDDQTITKCMGFADRWGCGSIEVVNLYALRATDPRDLIAAAAEGEHNERAWSEVLGALRFDGLVVAAWGASTHRRLLAPSAAYRAWEHTVQSWRCLGHTKDGEPRHPCRLGYDTGLVPFDNQGER